MSISAYGVEKQRKVREQFTAEFADIRVSTVFSDVVVWCNGRTDPPLAVLRVLVGRGGGACCIGRFSRRRVLRIAGMLHG